VPSQTQSLLRARKKAKVLAEADVLSQQKSSRNLTPIKAAARKAEVLAKFDKDGDGELNEEEKAAMKAAMPRREKRGEGGKGKGKGEKKGKGGKKEAAAAE